MMPGGSEVSAGFRAVMAQHLHEELSRHRRQVSGSLLRKNARLGGRFWGLEPEEQQ